MSTEADGAETGTGCPPGHVDRERLESAMALDFKKLPFWGQFASRGRNDGRRLGGRGLVCVPRISGEMAKKNE